MLIFWNCSTGFFFIAYRLNHAPNWLRAIVIALRIPKPVSLTQVVTTTAARSKKVTTMMMMSEYSRFTTCVYGGNGYLVHAHASFSNLCLTRHYRLLIIIMVNRSNNEGTLQRLKDPIYVSMKQVRDWTDTNQWYQLEMRAMHTAWEGPLHFIIELSRMHFINLWLFLVLL